MTNETNQDMMLHDALGRRIDYLRVSLTDRCNFRCLYCMPPEGIVKLRHEDMLRIEELAAVVQTLVERLGIRKVRVTGGEPLVRRNAIEFLTALGRMDGIEDLSLTTNGFFLQEKAAAIWDAGVRRLNISLDTLRRERFIEITRVDGLAQVLAGIEAARKQGFSPIKINVVCLRETLAEARDLMRFGLEKNLQVRFIELMPSLGNETVSFVPSSEVQRAIATEYNLVPLDDDSSAGGSSAARLFRIAGTDNICGFIAPVTQPFCTSCNRIRLRGDGKLLPCLTSATGYDLMPFVRPVLRADELVAHLRELLPRCKPRPAGQQRIRGMFKIGG